MIELLLFVLQLKGRGGGGGCHKTVLSSVEGLGKRLPVRSVIFLLSSNCNTWQDVLYISSYIQQ